VSAEQSIRLVELQISVVSGRTLPIDHGYQLFSAICRLVPDLHQSRFPWMMSTFPGKPVGYKMLALLSNPIIRLRLPLEQAGLIAEKCSGGYMEIDRHLIRLSEVAKIKTLRPAKSLCSRLVIIRSGGEYRIDKDAFFESLAKQLTPIIVQPKRVDVSLGPCRAVQVNHCRSHGYEVTIRGLSQSDSLTVQSSFIGGRQHYGAGFFEYV